MKPIFLLGYMGCGKTTLGEALAAEMGVPFIDLDQYIEHQENASISQIFAQQGEPAFRRLETDALRRVADAGAVVVACGGGTPCQPGNMELMNSLGTTIYLTTSIDRLTSRLTLPEQQAKRPLIAGKAPGEIREFITQALAQRNPFYSQAQLQFDSTDIETAEATTRRAICLHSLLATLHLA